MDDRSVTVKIGCGEDEQEYALLLTTRATIEIAEKYGGLDKMGEKMLQSGNEADALKELCWLIAVLANQTIMIYNLRHNDAPKKVVSAEELELITNPADLRDLQSGVIEAINKGMKRNVVSEEDGKNAQGE